MAVASARQHELVCFGVSGGRQVTDDSEGTSIPVAREALRTLIYGYASTQLLSIAARLRLAAHLATGPLPLLDLAARADVDPDMLRRIVNGLAAIGVVGVAENGEYHLTAIGEGLREDVPGSLASFAILSGEDYYRAWLGVDLESHDDVTPFARVFGAPVFDWYAQHPEAGDRFYQRMTTRIMSYAATVAAVADLSAAGRIVDIGGGHGLLLAAFLERWPAARGVLFDLPGAAAAGQARLAAAGLGDRVETVGGDFFAETEFLPEGDVYLLSQILHDWNDERSMAILRNVRRVINPEGRLLIVEVLMPERVAGPHPAVDLDLLMMVLTGGRERTASEHRTLLEETGFALERVHEAIALGGMSVLEVRPARV